MSKISKELKNKINTAVNEIIEARANENETLESIIMLQLDYFTRENVIRRLGELNY